MEENVTNYKAKNHGKRKELKKTTYQYRFHTLRHTYATFLLEKGVPIENIQRSLGHSQLDTTLIYAKVKDNRTKELVNYAFNTPMKLVNNTIQLSNSNDQETTQNNNINADEILKQRLARGEIDLATYKILSKEIC